MSNLAENAVDGISLRSVTKKYGDQTVLADVDLTVANGSRVALIGPSGSGKTTILRCIAMLDEVDSGSITIEGHEIAGTGLPTKQREINRELARRRIGMVFQQFNLFPNMSALANVTLAPRRVLKLSNIEAEARARELLAMVGLSQQAESLPHQLSGGQQQRVAIARSLAMDPAVLLFDEVTSALDPELVGEVLTVIRGLAESTHVTMLIVTHEMAFAREVADRVIFMESGTIVEQGAPGDVMDRPVHARTKKFLARISAH